MKNENRTNAMRRNTLAARARKAARREMQEAMGAMASHATARRSSGLFAAIVGFLSMRQA